MFPQQIKFLFLFGSLLVLYVNADAAVEQTDKKTLMAESKEPVDEKVDLSQEEHEDHDDVSVEAAENILAERSEVDETPKPQHPRHLVRRERQSGELVDEGGRQERRNQPWRPAKKLYKPLLRALNRDERHDLKRILKKDITKAEMAKRVADWAASEGGETQKAYEIYLQERQLMQQLQDMGDKHITNGKSDEAKQLYEGIKALREDQSLTWDETCTKKNELLAKYDYKIRRELRRKGHPCIRNSSWQQLGLIPMSRKTLQAIARALA